MQIVEAAKIVREFIDDSDWDSSEMDVVDALEALVLHVKIGQKDYIEGYFDGKAGFSKRYRGEIKRLEIMKENEEGTNEAK
jgi:hypothetical protein